MRGVAFLAFVVSLIDLVVGSTTPAAAACTLPYQLTNGQSADAAQVMGDFNALISCLSAAAPAGNTNAIQYNAGSGAFGGIGLLTDGQLLIGSTGGMPQPQTLTAGAGITITNAAGNITIATTGGPIGTGLYRQVMSATPTSAMTGLTNWLNQGTATVSDSAIGLTINAPGIAAGAQNMSARYMTAPTPPYTITALIAATRNSNSSSGGGIGWYDGSAKLHVMSYILSGGGAAFLEVEKWNSATSWNSNDFGSNKNAFAQPIWLQIRDDGTNVSFAFSQDGANFLQVFSVAKSSGWLGASGYGNVVFFTNPEGGQTLTTLMSWAQN